jgi:hypothetical protein
MHLLALDLRVENPKVAAQQGGNNFLFVGLDREINRK